MVNRPHFLKSGSGTIAFRLDPEALDELSLRAARTGTSPGVLARSVVEDWLRAEDKMDALTAEVFRVQRQLDELQKSVNQIVPKPVAQEDPWARFNYRRRGW